MITYYLRDLLQKEGHIPEASLLKILQKMQHDEAIESLYQQIQQCNQQILKISQVYKENQLFIEAHFPLPNAKTQEPYEAFIDLMPYPLIKIIDIENLEEIGLHYDKERQLILGKPTLAGSHLLELIFTHELDKDACVQRKQLTLIVNAHPRDLWKTIPSNPDDPYYKEEEATLAQDFLDRKIVVASKRGRSHAHEGTFRDDHFCVKNLSHGWSMVALADGAGSAKLARHGSRIATEFLVDSFLEKDEKEDLLQSLCEDIAAYFGFTTKEEILSPVLEPQEHAHINAQETEITLAIAQNEEISTEKISETPVNYKAKIINKLYVKVRELYTTLQHNTTVENCQLKDLNTTLIFALMKKFSAGYVVLTFSVGDCPINVLMPNFESVQLLNKLDVGEYGGGTRFITMREIFDNSMAQRFGIHFFEHFDKIFLMTDGIYDPKFITENKLEDIETWKTFMADLNGENEDNIKVDFIHDENIEAQLLTWMDFWSKGNHDDRTLAIIY